MIDEVRQPANTHLAQLNVAKAIDELDSKRMADFIAALDRINGVAERSPGFVWRLKDDSGNATDIETTDDPRFIVNISIWETPANLEQFVWNTVHKRVYDKKSEWFEAPAHAHFVMWWVPAGQTVSAEEALARLDHLNANGPSDRAFGWESLPNVQLWRQQQCA